LKWLVDIHEIISRFPVNRKKFEVLVKLLNAQRLVGLCNAMLGNCFPGSALLPSDAKVPAWIVRYSLHQMARKSDTPVYLREDLMTHRWFHIQAFPRMRYRLMKILLLIIFFLQNLKRKLKRIKPVNRITRKASFSGS
jgi:hypothetical protein